jgi:SecD/SecF fusion protein
MVQFRILANRKKDQSIVAAAEKDPTRTDVLVMQEEVARWLPVKRDEVKAFASSVDVVSRKSDRSPDTTEVLVLLDPSKLTDAYIKKAEVGTDNSGPCIAFTLDEAGAKLLAKLTGEHLPDRSANIQYRLGIILDGELVSAPVIKDVTSNQGKITGNFTKEQAAEIAETLNAGRLPVPLLPVP